MTKAERIFKNTRWECKKHIEAWGYETNPNGKSVGFTSLICDDNERICKRTVNAVSAILASERKRNELNLRYDIITEDKFRKTEQILNMVDSTIENTIKSIAERN